MAPTGDGTDVDTDALRNYARSCERSADWVRTSVLSSLEYPSTIAHNAWDGGNMTKALQLQHSLDAMRASYNRTRSAILSRLYATADDLDGTGQQLRRSADDYDNADETTRDRLQLWP